jgi:hypothetical protein
LGYGAYVRDFYGAWSNFTSTKSFIWMDKWKLSDAPSRFVRRQMEKENKKARDTGRKEYNDTVRVSYCHNFNRSMFKNWFFRVLQNSSERETLV